MRHEVVHAARSLRARNLNRPDRSGSSRRASDAARTDTHAGTRAAAISFDARAHERIHQGGGLESKATYFLPRARAAKSNDNIEQLDSGAPASNRLAQQPAQQIPVDRAPELLASDDITHSSVRTNSSEREQLQMFTVDAAAALEYACKRCGPSQTVTLN
jgi:hypothetical protein